MTELASGQVIERDGKKFLVVGKTFSTKVKVSGDLASIVVEGETLNVEKDDDGKVSKVSLWVPTFIKRIDAKPDSLKSIIARAEKHGVLQEKVRHEDDSVEYLPTEPGSPATADKAQALANYPDESKKLKFTAQNHARGRSVHLDMRFEFKRGDDHFLRGWTVANQIPGAIKEPITTMELAKKANANPRNWKMNLKTGIIKERQTRGGLRRGNLRAFPKAAEIPSDWLKVEGVTKKQDPGEPPPAGATREFPGVFTILDKGEVAWGMQKPWAKEYFLDGGKWHGRWMFRLVGQQGEKWHVPENEEECMALKAEVLPPGQEEERPRTAAMWILIQPKDQRPYTLSKEAIKSNWLPPKGVSCLPKKLRASVPKGLRYWEMDRADALKARATLAEMEELGGTELKQTKRQEFVLTKRTWRGQITVRFGPSTKVWDLFIKENGKVWRLALAGDPLRDDEIAGQPAHGHAVTSTEGIKSDVFDLKLGSSTDIKPGSAMNPTKETPAKLEVLDAGDAVPLTVEQTIRKYEFKGKQLKGAWFFRAEDEKQPKGFWLMSKSGGPQTKESDMREITVLIDDEQLEADDEKGLMEGDAEQLTAAQSLRHSLVTAIDSVLNRGVKAEDEKAGRRLRGDKVQLLKKLKKELEDVLKAVAEVLGWASYKPERVPTPLETWMASREGVKALAELLTGDRPSIVGAFKALDGRTWWMQWTTNAFQDREREIFTTKAIEDYVARHEDEDVKGQFWFWHIPGTKFGDVRFQATVGRFLMEAGPFDDTPVGNAFEKFFLENPTGHPTIAPEGWGSSHKYLYDSEDREDAVYDWFEIRESTTLPAHVASNPYNPQPTILEVKEMNEKQQQALCQIGGDELLQQVLKIGKSMTKDLEEAGVGFKVQEEDEKAGSFVKQIRAVLSDVKDEGLRKQVEGLAAKLEEAYPYPAPKSAEKEEEEEAEAKVKTEAEPESESSEDEKARGDMKKLGGQLRMIAGRIGGEVGKKLRVVADAMLDLAAGEKGEASPASGEKEEGQEEGGEKDEEDALSREEVGEALKTVVEALHDEIESLRGEFATTVKSLAEIIEPLVRTVTELRVSDEERIAQKAAEIPTASLDAIVQSVIGNKATRVDGRSAEAKDGPKVTEPGDGPTGVPGIDNWILHPGGS